MFFLSNNMSNPMRRIWRLCVCWRFSQHLIHQTHIHHNQNIKQCVILSICGNLPKYIRLFLIWNQLSIKNYYFPLVKQPWTYIRGEYAPIRCPIDNSGFIYFNVVALSHYRLELVNVIFIPPFLMLAHQLKSYDNFYCYRFKR